MGGRILIVDGDVDVATLLRGALRRRGYEAESVASGVDALRWLDARPADVILAHLRMPHMSGVELCVASRNAHPEVCTIVLTGDGMLDSAIAAIRAGAYDYITKPIDLEALVIALERAVSHVRLTREVHKLRSEAESERPIATIVGDSPAARRVLALVHKVANSDTTVLVAGESGTGKELVARAIHDASPRRSGPFVALNCAALPASLLESELFGHVKGAFTDARRDRTGVFAQAEGGTILLDEIGEMPLEMQAKLLRVLQDHRVRPVGSDEELAFDARVIASTNRALEVDVAQKRFREDLYYRINVVQIVVPPLRARPGDVLALAQHFTRKIAARTRKTVMGISVDAARHLVDHDWPGNVRELENTMERAVALTNFDEIMVEDLPERVRGNPGGSSTTSAVRPDDLVSLAEVERRHIRQVMRAVGGNKTMAARILGIDRRSLYRRLGEPGPSDDDTPLPST
ncbi:MAG: sigma-54 dependent transcriptional regulator [Deltaproteobacteria bacterium]|nr:sigma-54 dependent transcriptional regulator [Kofleriaceae bacterium]